MPGSSDVVLGGVVAYANEVKERELGVRASTLAEHGAVSAEVAAALAHGVRERLGAAVGVSVTGVAGPGGGTPEKPVGSSTCTRRGRKAALGRELSFPGDRAGDPCALGRRSRSIWCARS